MSDRVIEVAVGKLEIAGILLRYYDKAFAVSGRALERARLLGGVLAVSGYQRPLVSARFARGQSDLPG